MLKIKLNKNKNKNFKLFIKKIFSNNKFQFKKILKR